MCYPNEPSATYSGEEVSVDFTCTMEKADYGVPGSPVWDEPTNITVTGIEILGVGCALKDLPKDLQHACFELASEVTWA